MYYNKNKITREWLLKRKFVDDVDCEMLLAMTDNNIYKERITVDVQLMNDKGERYMLLSRCSYTHFGFSAPEKELLMDLDKSLHVSNIAHIKLYTTLRGDPDTVVFCIDPSEIRNCMYREIENIDFFKTTLITFYFEIQNICYYIDMHISE